MEIGARARRIKISCSLEFNGGSLLRNHAAMKKAYSSRHGQESNERGGILICGTPGPWFVWFSLMRFSFVRSFKRYLKYLLCAHSFIGACNNEGN